MLSGLMSPARAVRFLINNKGLIRYFIIPFTINTIIFLFFAYYSINWLPEIIRSFLPESGGSLIKIAYFILMTISLALILLISVSCFSILGNVIATPFNELLTQNVEKIVLGIPPDESDFSIKDLMKILKGLWEAVGKICLAAFIIIALLPLNLVPLIGQILYLLLNSLVVAIFLGLEFFSYSLDRRDYSFKQKLHFIKINIFDVLGVGLSAWILLLIPVINFSILPLAAIGATLCFCGYEEKKSVQGSKFKVHG